MRYTFAVNLFIETRLPAKDKQLSL